MNVEEIKASITMRELVERYGYKVNRASMMRCPFHADKDASLKIYKDSFHCFGCGASGDVFTFTQKALNCDFKTAFVSLGGEYDDNRKKHHTERYHFERRQVTRKRKKKKSEMTDMELFRSMHEAQDELRRAADDSDEMWDAIEKLNGAWLELLNREGGEVNEADRIL